MNKYELLMQKLQGNVDMEKDASMDKTAAFSFGEAMAEGFFSKLASLVEEANKLAADAATPDAAQAVAAQAAPAATSAPAAVAQQAMAAQAPVDNAINTGATITTPNPGNDYINSQLKAQIDMINQAYANNPAQLQAALAQLTPDQVNELLKIPEIADKIKPLLNHPSTNTGAVPVSGTGGATDPSNTPGATPVV